MEQNKMKKIVPMIIGVIAVGAISFYGGVKYSESNFSARGGSAWGGQNLTPEQRQQMFQQGGVRTGRNGTGVNIPRGGDGAGMNLINGEVISKDDKSITIKLRDGGSKIVFFSDKTSITKTAVGIQSDVVVGEQVMVNGTANVDGSVAASIIQLRPALPPLPSGSPVPSK
jgi:hypothetical protein